MLLRQHARALQQRCIVSAVQICSASARAETLSDSCLLRDQCDATIGPPVALAASPYRLPGGRSFASQAEATHPASQHLPNFASPPTTDAAVAAEIPEQYTRLDRITGRYTVSSKPAFAVVEVGPTQFKVCQGDVIITEKLKGLDVNERVSLNRVLMLGTLQQTVIGRPFVPQASVTAAVEEQFRDGKVIIFKKKRRKNSRRQNGHRQALTTLRILHIDGIEDSDKHEPVLATF